MELNVKERQKIALARDFSKALNIQKAVEKSFLSASWQMCHVHLLRAVLRNVTKKYHIVVTEEIKNLEHNGLGKSI